VLSVALVGAAAIVVDRVVRDRDTFIRSVDGDRAILWAVGDGANGSADGKAVAALIARDSVDAVLYLGDVYNEGTAEDFEENYDTTYGRLSSVTAPTSGNHEADNEDEGYDPYWRRAHGERPPDWYAFEAAGWAILSLDSELDDDDDESEQRRWVEAQVRAPGTCRIAFWHRPRFSAGTRYGDEQDMEALWNALRGHAAIVLSGHEHNMQRFKPIDGIVQFVSGAGGAKLYSLRSDDRLSFGDDDTHGALRLDLRPGVARYAFVAADGETLDSGTVRCRPLL
jgi:acid phosphatase type 7